MQPELMRVNDFCHRYAVSRATLYRLVQRGELSIVKIGSASRIKTADAEAWLTHLQE